VTPLTADCMSSFGLRIGPRVTTRPSARPSTATTTIISSSVNPVRMEEGLPDNLVMVVATHALAGLDALQAFGLLVILAMI
jgi:hypothetical protein